MPPDGLDFRQRAQLAERMDAPCSREELRACLRDIARLNRWMMGHRPLFEWLKTARIPGSGPLRILDVGCGYGDGLRRIAQWANARGAAVELMGLDINPDTVAIAAEATPAECGIEWIGEDVFAYQPRKPMHLIVSSLFTHHLDDAGVVRFLCWMERHATVGWFVNDLSRSAIPYHFLKAFVRIANLHPFVRNDGPVSIARSFQPADWRKLCSAAGLDGSVSIRAYTPARLCVARSKTP
jgi:SAM-dependent methyltransferase